MKMLKTTLPGVVLFITGITLISPAMALGGCGPKGHRNAWGQCVWGG
jgi:hypothetical protein